MAFHDGRQWVAFDGRQLFEPQLEPWRAKLTDNRLRGMVRKEIARMTKARPQWVGVPATVEDDEIDAARLRERVFEHDWQYLDVARKRRAAQKWAPRVRQRVPEDHVGLDDRARPRRDGRPGRQVAERQYGAPVTPQRVADLPPELLQGPSSGPC
jgi:hypothetical protein